MARFFFDWASGMNSSPGVSISWFDALPKMYATADQNGLLYKSIQSLAHINHGMRCGNAESHEKGAHLYGEALRAMREIILSKDDKTPMRDILVAVILLSIHEV
jgi:hypothetical protein